MRASIVSALKAIARLVMDGLGIVTVTVACVLITQVIYTIASEVIPLITSPHSLSRYLLLGAWSIVSFGVIFNYLMAVGTDPGSISRDFVEWAISTGNLSDIPYCRTCMSPRPERAHHCSICNRCVLKMDHHCPWINNCVGYFNQRYFVGFLIYLLLGTAFAALCLSHVFWLHPTSWSKRYSAVSSSTLVTFVFILTVAIFFAMCFFVTWNGIMVLSNQTSIEYHPNSDERAWMASRGEVFRHRYDLGKANNAAEVFGDNPIRCWVPWTGPLYIAPRQGTLLGYLWALAPSLQPMSSDGTAFPTWGSSGISDV